MIHLIRQPATEPQIQEMREAHGSFIKVAVDIHRKVLAGGGEFHADCESLLMEDGSRREDVWAADWLPTERKVRFTALINIRPRVNPGMEIRDAGIRQRLEKVVRTLLERS